jgi:hypothetical protein
MRPALLAAAALALGCGAERPPAPAAVEIDPKELAALRYKAPELPARASLPCFKCHDFAKFGEGGRFPHDLKPHQKVGHCHRCHLGIAHHGNAPDTAVCKGCHEDPPEGFGPAWPTE